MRTFRHIVVAYDGSDTAEEALARIPSIADEETEVTVVAAVGLHPTSGRAMANIDVREVEASERALEHACEFLGAHGVTAEPLPARGDPATAVTEAAAEGEVDLIVCGAGELGRLERLVSRSVSDRILRRADCDVLVVRSGPDRRS
jgi:nucleotide-binding universal stress UspA family protein